MCRPGDVKSCKVCTKLNVTGLRYSGGCFEHSNESRISEPSKDWLLSGCWDWRNCSCAYCKALSGGLVCVEQV